MWPYQDYRAGRSSPSNLALLPVAERTFEVTLAGTLLHEYIDWRTAVDVKTVNDFRDTMEQLSVRALAVYREFVHDDPALFTLFLNVTPVAELADARFGSRPAYRPGAQPGIEGIRAIPWGFGWTQIRLMLPGWLGVGTALAEALATPEGQAKLTQMARTWPFFDDLLAKIQMVCAKTDLDIARAYVQQLHGDQALLQRLEAEYVRTVDARCCGFTRQPTSFWEIHQCCRRPSHFGIHMLTPSRCSRSSYCDANARSPNRLLGLPKPWRQR